MLGRLEERGAIGSAWRTMFLIGLAPACWRSRSSCGSRSPSAGRPPPGRKNASWRASPSHAHKLGSLAELFGDPRWRRNTIVGMLLAFAGVVGLWGIGFFSFDLVRSVFRKHFQGQGFSAQEIAGKLTFWTGITSLLQNAGAFFGIYAFARITIRSAASPPSRSRSCWPAMATAFTFWFLDDFWQIFWLIPIMGFCQLALFGGYAIYFPELFPTRLRSTGTSFCYNVGRLVAAAGPSVWACSPAGSSTAIHEPMRYAGMTMCSVFLIGLLALPFAPETQGSRCRSRIGSRWTVFLPSRVWERFS